MKRYFEFIGEDNSRKSETAVKFWEVAGLSVRAVFYV